MPGQDNLERLLMLRELERLQREQSQRQIRTFADLAADVAARTGKRSDRVTVTAPKPGMAERVSTDDPALMERIALGTATEPPLGMYSPEGAQYVTPSGEHLPAPLRAAWEEAAKRWPFATKYISGVGVGSSSGLAHYDRGDNTITVDPSAAATEREVLLQILAHELTHAGQQRAFPQNEGGGLVPQYDRPYVMFSTHPLDDAYYRKPGEQQGDDAGFAVFRNILRENMQKANKR